jgi:CXXC-20-CXXC protein
VKPKFHHRSCPVCGNRVNWQRLYLKAWIFAKWQCPSCGTPLRFDFGFRWLIAILLILWTGFVFLAIRQHLRPLWAVIFFLGAVVIGRLDRIAVARPSDRENKEQDLRQVRKDA